MTCTLKGEIPNTTMTVKCRRAKGHDGKHWDGLLYTWEEEC